MIVDGLKFNKCHTVTKLPVRDSQGNLMPYVKEGKEHFVYFGQIVNVPSGAAPEDKLIDTGLVSDGGSKVFAKVIPVKEYSADNVMYSKGAYNGFAYLFKDGKFFRAKVGKQKSVDAVVENVDVVVSADSSETGETVAPTDQKSENVTTEEGVNLSELV